MNIYGDNCLLSPSAYVAELPLLNFYNQSRSKHVLTKLLWNSISRFKNIYWNLAAEAISKTEFNFQVEQYIRKFIFVQ